MEKFAKIAYNAFGDSCCWRDEKGNPLSQWQDLTQKTKDAWKNSCHALLVQAQNAPNLVKTELVKYIAPIYTI